MNLASERLKSTLIPSNMFLKSPSDQNYELQEMADLAQRFRDAHTRLNTIELSLHEALGSNDRLSLLQTLEEARMDYSDARFALSTRNIISSR